MHIRIVFIFSYQKKTKQQSLKILLLLLYFRNSFIYFVNNLWSKFFVIFKRLSKHIRIVYM